MRTMIGNKLKKSPTMCITVSMKSVKFCPNPYHCTHSNGNSAETYTHCTHISQRNSIPWEVL